MKNVKQSSIHTLLLGLVLLGGSALVSLAYGQMHDQPAEAPAMSEQVTAPGAVSAEPGHADPTAEHADALPPDEQAAHDAAHGMAGDEHGDAHAGHGEQAPTNPLWIIPFALLLGCIALMPLVAHKFWEHNYPWFALAFFLVGLAYYAVIRPHATPWGDFDTWWHAMHPWIHEMKEYVSFIALLFALFVVSGGIVINVSRKATPLANCTLLLTGAVIANIFGTTGAAMLLIRPYIRINRAHIKPYHIVFFIFLVANVGGCLTPIGDPPLFLGYLKGVPFWWVLENCWREWAVATLMLLVIFFVIDKLDHAKAERLEPAEHDTGPAVRINGIHNFLFILVVLVGVFQQSVFDNFNVLLSEGLFSGALIRFALSREIIMVVAAIVSKLVTKPGIFERNEFTWEPIREVAILFVAIFSTMVPALQWLDANADTLGLDTPGKFYFVTGALSSTLDNAPTYLTFLQTEMGQVKQRYGVEMQQVRKALDEIEASGDENFRPKWLQGPNLEQVRDDVETVMRYHPTRVMSNTLNEDRLRIDLMIAHDTPNPNERFPLNVFLVAISVGAVFFGAMTYIGNAPNFMVKSIAESSGISMPSFLGYVVRYSLPILLPVYIVIWYLFFVLGF